MLSTMQDGQLSLANLLRHGTSVHSASEVITWTGSEARRESYEELGKHTSGCSQYWVAIPKVAGKNLFPRKLPVKNVHNFGKAFRATAEFHWGSSTDANGKKTPGWKNVEVVNGDTREIPRSKYFRVDWYA